MKRIWNKIKCYFGLHDLENDYKWIWHYDDILSEHIMKLQFIVVGYAERKFGKLNNEI